MHLRTCIGLLTLTIAIPIANQAGATTVANGLTANGLTANGLSWNGLSWNGLSANGLATNGTKTGSFKATSVVLKDGATVSLK